MTQDATGHGAAEPGVTGRAAIGTAAGVATRPPARPERRRSAPGGGRRGQSTAGVLGATAALVTAVGGTLGILVQTGVIHGSGSHPSNATQSSSSSGSSASPSPGSDSTYSSGGVSSGSTDTGPSVTASPTSTPTPTPLLPPLP